MWYSGSNAVDFVVSYSLSGKFGTAKQVIPLISPEQADILL